MTIDSHPEHNPGGDVIHRDDLPIIGEKKLIIEITIERGYAPTQVFGKLQYINRGSHTLAKLANGYCTLHFQVWLLIPGLNGKFSPLYKLLLIAALVSTILEKWQQDLVRFLNLCINFDMVRKLKVESDGST